MKTKYFFLVLCTLLFGACTSVDEDLAKYYDHRLEATYFQLEAVELNNDQLEFLEAAEKAIVYDVVQTLYPKIVKKENPFLAINYKYWLNLAVEREENLLRKGYLEDQDVQYMEGLFQCYVYEGVLDFLKRYHSEKGEPLEASYRDTCNAVILEVSQRYRIH